MLEKEFGYPILQIPNKVMKELYSQYFLELVSKEMNFTTDINFAKIGVDIAFEGKIDKIINIVHAYLNNLSNRDYQKFDEKYIKLIFYCIVMNLKEYSIKSEPEFKRNYPDILIVPRDSKKPYHSIMVEFKYLKAGEKSLLPQAQNEAKEQVKKYMQFEEIQNIENLNAYTIVAVNDELYVEKVK